MDDAEIAGMKPAAGKRLVRRRLVLETPFHADVAAITPFAKRLPAAGAGCHCSRTDHIETPKRAVANPLARLLPRLFGRGERIPFRVPVVDHRRSVALGQSVKMRD